MVPTEANSAYLQGGGRLHIITHRQFLRFELAGKLYPLVASGEEKSPVPSPPTKR